jgi:hypothetical protein
MISGSITSLPLEVCGERVIKEAVEDLDGVRTARLFCDMFNKIASDWVHMMQ